MQAVGLLVRRVRAAAPHDELSLTEAAVLKHLAVDGGSTTADLARAERVKPQSMGATVAALEEAGLVRRRAHATDGRQVLIELTDKGWSVRDNRKAAKLNWLSEAAAGLDKEDREQLQRAVEILRRLAEK